MKIVQFTVGFMEVFCYLVFDEESGEGILIDPAGSEDRVLSLLKEHNVKLKYIVNTHGHADHTCGNDVLKEATGARVVMSALDDDFFQRPDSRAMTRMMGFKTSGKADVRVKDGETITFGKVTAKFILTPGHTPGGCCILIDGNLFTGDTLFVGAVGRTDFPGSSFDDLIVSLGKIVKLPPETVIWPGHDYGDRPTSTVAREMQSNPYITDFLNV